MTATPSHRPQAIIVEADPAKIVGMLRDYGLALRRSAEARGGDLEAKARAIRDGDSSVAEKREAVAMLRSYARGLLALGREAEAAGVTAQADALERDR